MSDNPSGIHPKGYRVLIQPIEPEVKTASGIIVATEETKYKEEMANTTGVVVELGPVAFSDYGDDPWCAVGDKIIFAKYAGLLYIGKDGIKYRVINDSDVVATLDADVQLVDPHLTRGI